MSAALEPVKRAMPESTATVAAALGADPGLGDNRATAWRRRDLPVLRWILLAIAALTVGIPETVDAAGKARALTAGMFGVVFLLGCFLAGLGFRGGAVTRRLYCCAAGVVEYVPGEPEPRVVRWDDVERVTIAYYRPAGSGVTLLHCLLSGRDNSVLALLAYPGRGLHRLVTEADRVLAPRLVPPLISAYESGEPVTIGGWRIDQGKGITVDLVTGSRVSWANMRQIEILYSPRHGHGAIAVLGVRIRQRWDDGAPAISVSGVPNGIFLPHLIEHAAERHGIQVRRYPRRAGDHGAARAPAD